MPRIRTYKPELFTNERCNEVSVTALVTFLGLLPQADDWGRHRDNAAVIGGVIWPMRGEHTAVHVEEDLTQLAAAGLIHRYTGCDGKRYLHIVGWFEHQKIEKRSQSRYPVCTDHHRDHRCGPCGGPCRTLTDTHPAAPDSLAEITGPGGDARPGRADASPTPAADCAELSPASRGGFGEGSPNPPGTFDHPVQPIPTPSRTHRLAPPGREDTLPDPADDPDHAAGKTAGQNAFAEGSPHTPRTIGEPSLPGSRILDPGSSFPTGREAPGAGAVSAKELIGEYVAGCDRRPPGDVLGHLGRITRKLLGEGIAPEYVRAGLRRYAEIQGHPSRLPSLVNDAMNAPGGSGAGLARPGSRPNLPAHTAWTNPVDAATAYAEEL